MPASVKRQCIRKGRGDKYVAIFTVVVPQDCDYTELIDSQFLRLVKTQLSKRMAKDRNDVNGFEAEFPVSKYQSFAFKKNQFVVRLYPKNLVRKVQKYTHYASPDVECVFHSWLNSISISRSQIIQMMKI